MYNKYMAITQHYTTYRPSQFNYNNLRFRCCQHVLWRCISDVGTREKFVYL